MHVLGAWPSRGQAPGRTGGEGPGGLARGQCRAGLGGQTDVCERSLGWHGWKQVFSWPSLFL